MLEFKGLILVQLTDVIVYIFAWQMSMNVHRPPPIAVTKSMERVATPPVDMTVLATRDSLELVMSVPVS